VNERRAHFHNKLLVSRRREWKKMKEGGKGVREETGRQWVWMETEEVAKKESGRERERESE
jgi:hypothetical protein